MDVLAKINLVNTKEPEYGLKYVHLTQEEIAYIIEQNGCHVKSFYERVSIFISRNKNLRHIEEEINDVEKLTSAKHTPFAYILYLALYGRIKVSFRVLRKIIGRNYNQVYYEGSKFKIGR